MHWRTSLATASCAASCSGVRSNFTSANGFDGGSSVPRAAGGRLLCCRACGIPPERATRRGVIERLGSRPADGIAMCKTPMNYLYARALAAVQPGWLGCRSGDDAAGDPVAGVAGGVGLHVVGLLVDHDGGATVGDDAVRGGGVEGEVGDLEGGLSDVAFADGDVLGQVAVVVAHGVEGAVLLVVRIEVAASGLEVRCVAEGFLVDVDGVLAYGEVFEAEFDGELAFFLLEGCGAGVLACAGLEGDDEGVLGFGERGDGEETEGEGGWDEGGGGEAHGLLS